MQHYVAPHKLAVYLDGQGLLNWQYCLARYRLDRDEVGAAALRRRLMGQMVSAAADTLARSYGVNFGLIGNAFELRPWTDAEWALHCMATGREMPSAAARQSNSCFTI